MKQYEEVDRVESSLRGTPVKLLLRQRLDDGDCPYPTVSWRTVYPGDRRKNRRFYWLQADGCWKLPVGFAVGAGDVRQHAGRRQVEMRAARKIRDDRVHHRHRLAGQRFVAGAKLGAVVLTVG